MIIHRKIMFDYFYCTDSKKYSPNLQNIWHPRGQKFHSSARIYEWILERTSDSFRSARPTGRVLKSAGETSIF